MTLLRLGLPLRARRSWLPSSLFLSDSRSSTFSFLALANFAEFERRSITDLANSFTIVQNGTDIASILVRRLGLNVFVRRELIVCGQAPMGSAKTISISHPVPRTTTGDLTLALPEAPLTIPDTAAAHK